MEVENAFALHRIVMSVTKRRKIKLKKKEEE